MDNYKPNLKSFRKELIELPLEGDVLEYLQKFVHYSRLVALSSDESEQGIGPNMKL